jgi:signal transduction histidine kinase/CheY-like chemotaxis protein
MRAASASQAGAAIVSVQRPDVYFEFAPDATLVTDARGRIIAANRAARELLAGTQESLEGVRLHELFAAQGAGLQQALERLAACPEPLTVHTQLPPGSGTARGTVLRAAVLPQGGDVLVIWTLRCDVPNAAGGPPEEARARKALEDERDALLESERAARSEVERASRMKDEFVATLSHELRTPLTAILGWTQLLRRGALPPGEMLEALETIESNARVQKQMIEDLLDVNRIVAGKLRLVFNPVDLKLLARDVLVAVRPSAAVRNVTLIEDLAPRISRVQGDATRLYQVLWNLLNNAIKFTPPGGRVCVSLRRDQRQVVLSVTDTGVGIAPDVLPQLFQHFRQAERNVNRRFGGLGLGLAIVRQIVELHGGTVRAESGGRDAGATFTIELPQRRRRRDAAESGPLAGELGGGGPFSLAGVAVLIVDDDAEIRHLLGRVLSECDASITQVGSAADALRALEDQPPHVLVSDLSMPGEDGFALIRRVRALPGPTGRVPAIALTAYTRPQDQERALAAGFQDHLAKPFEPVELMRRIVRLVATPVLPTQVK